MLTDAVGYPPVGGIPQGAAANDNATPGTTGMPASMKQKSAESPDQSGGKDMEDDVKNALTAMGFKFEDGTFITQLKQLMEDKKALEERAKTADAEIQNLKAQCEKFTKKIEAKTQKIENMKFEQFTQKLPKGLYPKTEEAKDQLRKEWDEDRDAVTNKLLATVKGYKPKEQEGVTNAATPPAADPLAEVKNMAQKKARGIGTLKFSADGTRIWED
jgi:predicted RNase H-like nuclease (RuvC/YqgF family)